MKKILLGFAVVTGVIFLACSWFDPVTDPDNQPREMTGTESQLVQSTNSFGFELFRELVAAEPDNNLFISPLSVSFALGMAYNGAAGGTETAMRTTLGYGDMSETEINGTYRSLITLLQELDPSLIMNIANSAWYREGFTLRQEFISVLEAYFEAEVQGLDFSDPSAVDIINGWVDLKTSGRITEIIDSIPPEAVLYLINALYFKAAWTTAFDPEATSDAPFNLPDGGTKNCPMMNQMSTFPYFSNDMFEAVALPYGNEEFSMTILLPKQGKTVADITARLTPLNWESWLSSLVSRELTLRLPKFNMEYEIELKDILTALGMGVAFTQDADFSRMSETGHLMISKVKHKTFVQVDEEGTEAAAVTAVEVVLTSAGQTMIVDRPFLFIIHDRHTGTLLFTGVVADPEFKE